MQLHYFPLLRTLWIGVTCMLAGTNTTDCHVCLFFSGLLLLQRPVWISWEAKPNRSEAWVIWNRRCCDKKTKTLRCFTHWFASVNCSGCDRWLMIESCLLFICFPLFLYWKPFHSFIMLSSWEVLCAYLLNLHQHELIAKSVPSYSCFQTLALWMCCVGA